MIISYMTGMMEKEDAFLNKSFRLSWAETHCQ